MTKLLLKSKSNLVIVLYILRVNSINVARIGPGDPGHPNRNANNDKNVTKKSYCFFNFFKHFSRTTVSNNNIDDQGALALSIQFLPTNLNVQPG